MDNKKFEKKMDFKAINILVDEIIDGKYNCENYELGTVDHYQLPFAGGL